MDPILLGEILSVAMLGFVALFLLVGFPVAFTLGGVAILFALTGVQLEILDPSYFNAISSRLYGILTNETLIAVPFFILMGMILERSGIAAELMTSMGQLLAPVRGGLGVAIVIVGTLLAACTGVVGATIVTISLITLPTMLRAGYDPRLAAGLICASGTLGTIIPPSVVLIFLAVILEASYTEAQLALGNFAPRPLSVGELFAGALAPGMLLAALYIVFIVAVGWLRPSACPPLAERDMKRGEALGARLAIAIIPSLFLILGVLGSILVGLATPTESAAVGAVCAFLLASVKQAFGGQVGTTNDVAPQAVTVMLTFWTAATAAFFVSGLIFGAIGVLSLVSLVALVAFAGAAIRGARAFLRLMREAFDASVKLTAMVFLIFFGATVFSLIFGRLGGDELIKQALTEMPGGRLGALLTVMTVIFVLGFFLDTFEIIFLAVPLTAPALFALDVDPVWLAVLIAVNLQTSFITPPFGFSLFYFKSVAGSDVPTASIYQGVAPFVAIQIACLATLWAFPGLATALPRFVFG